MNVPVSLPQRMHADEFLRWAEEQLSERFELLDGEVVSMAPERVGHNETKLRWAMKLFDAVARAGLDCQVFTDGMALAVDEDTVFEPDAMVRCGPRLDRNATVATDPVIIVEVISPSSVTIDTSEKLSRYLKIPSLSHYLIAQPSSSTVIHHARGADGWLTQLVGPGSLRLDPPGITLALD